MTNDLRIIKIYFTSGCYEEQQRTKLSTIMVLEEEKQ